MNLLHWKAAVIADAAAYAGGDTSAFDLVAQMLYESQRAKCVLREKGYGVTGMGILETAQEVPVAQT